MAAVIKTWLIQRRVSGWITHSYHHTTEQYMNVELHVKWAFFVIYKGIKEL